MTNLQLLYLSHDGAIPDSWVREAITTDLAASRDKPRDPVRLKVKVWKPEGIIDRMAAEMMRFAASRPCYRSDLAQAGFSTKEIDRHAEDARALTARRLADNPNAPRPIEIPVTELLTQAAAQRRQSRAT
ncbi:MAG TPA: hypothetical protein VHQ39_00750 [Dongiaceae bacterium]|nr:hypothetical protein [Dongiaceae bacterium]